MEKNFVLNGNKLIAEFLYKNRYKNSKDIEDCYVEEPNSSMITFYITDSKYHKSWDWLMPVVEKIENQFCSSNIHYYSAGKMKQQYIVEFLGYNIDYDNSQWDKSKIKAVYQAVIEFIEWYNKNK